MNSYTKVEVNEVNPTTAARKKRVIRHTLLLAVPALALAMGALWYLHSGRYVSTDNAYVKADKIPISAEVSGVVKDVFVSENQKVDQGELLYRLDPAQFQVAVAKAQAKLAQVRTELAAQKASYMARQAQLDVAKTQLEFAEKQQHRQLDLRKQDYVSAMQLDEAQQSARMARLEVTAAEKDLQRIAEALGGQPEAPLEQHPLYLSAEAELAQAQLELDWTQVQAPKAGAVNMPPRIGQHLNAGATAMTLVVIEHPWVEANFTETELTHVHEGQTVVITVDTYPDQQWQGHVVSLSPATGAEFSLLPAQNVTGNWVKIAQRIPVRIELEHSAEAPQLRAGMSSEVSIDTQYRRSLLGFSF